jgi:Zn-finger nucleic acid-binding protein
MNCPVCGQEMTKRRSYGEVEIDLCQEHGIWLDKNELMRILDAHGEQGRGQRGDSADDRQRGRFEGMFLGWLSLFLPT